MKTQLHEYDVVKVVHLSQVDRYFDGSETVRRAPRVGDVGTIVHEVGGKGRVRSFVVEMVSLDGHTIWLADFQGDELELVTPAV